MRHLTVAAAFLTVCLPDRLTAQCPDGAPPPCRVSRTAAATAAPAANSVAVLYFDNLSRDSNDLYLADGLTEEVISRLSGMERLSVRSRHVVRRFRGAAVEDPAAVGRSLNVTYLVTGSIRRAGDRLRVSAELIRAANGVQVWGRRFDQASGDVFAIQEAVSREVATGIVGRLVPAERQVLASRPTSSLTAYDAFLRGNFYLARRDSMGMTRAIREYESALRADPAFTDALSRIALIYGIAFGNNANLGLPPDSVTALALRTADEAVRRAPNSADAWMSMAMARFAADPRALVGAREANERAVALDPGIAEAHHLLGFTLSFVDDSASNDHYMRALAIEPARPITLANLSQSGFLAGRYAESLRWADSALAVDPDFTLARLMRGALLLLMDQSAQARAEMERWQSLPSLRMPAAVLRAALALSRGDTAAVRNYREQVIQPVLAASATRACTLAAILLHTVGDREGALMLLERASPRAAQLRIALTAVVFDPVRADPRFQRLVRESSP